MTAPHAFKRCALYGETNAAIAAEFLHIEPISARSSRYEWTIAPHSHPGIFQIILLERGSARLSADNLETLLRPASLIAIPSGSIHSFAFAEDAEGWVLSIASALVNDNGIATLAPDGGFIARGTTGVAPVLHHRAAQRLGWLLHEIAKDFADRGGGHLSGATLAAVAMVLALCGEVLEQDEPPRQLTSGTEARREKLVQRFCNLVERHFRQSWKISRYAMELGTSAASLGRACQTVRGRSPGGMVLDRILLEAMRALTYSSASVNRIAQDLGFADAGYFARFFKARTGMSASAFRARREWFANQDRA